MVDMTEQCPVCLGNDFHMPCAYPSEGKQGCLRDKRLRHAHEAKLSDLGGVMVIQNNFARQYKCCICDLHPLEILRSTWSNVCICKTCVITCMEMMEAA
jgi:hypothetical protein